MRDAVVERPRWSAAVCAHAQRRARVHHRRGRRRHLHLLPAARALRLPHQQLPRGWPQRDARGRRLRRARRPRARRRAAAVRPALPLLRRRTRLDARAPAQRDARELLCARSASGGARERRPGARAQRRRLRGRRALPLLPDAAPPQRLPARRAARRRHAHHDQRQRPRSARQPRRLRGSVGDVCVVLIAVLGLGGRGASGARAARRPELRRAQRQLVDGGGRRSCREPPRGHLWCRGAPVAVDGAYEQQARGARQARARRHGRQAPRSRLQCDGAADTARVLLYRRRRGWMHRCHQRRDPVGDVSDGERAEAAHARGRMGGCRRRPPRGLRARRALQARRRLHEHPAPHRRLGRLYDPCARCGTRRWHRQRWERDEWSAHLIGRRGARARHTRRRG